MVLMLLTVVGRRGIGGHHYLCMKRLALPTYSVLAAHRRRARHTRHLKGNQEKCSNCGSEAPHENTIA